jgi:hypothetical protein
MKKMGGTCCTLDREENACCILIEKSERKKPPCRPKRRWDDNIRMDESGSG